MNLFLFKLVRLFNTAKYLRFVQIYFRLFYFARARARKVIGVKYEFLKWSNSTPLKLINSCKSNSVYKDREFNFLN